MILVHHLSHPWGIAIYESFLYYTDEEYEVIERVDKSSGGNKVVLRDNVPNLRGLRVYHRRSKYFVTETFMDVWCIFTCLIILKCIILVLPISNVFQK
jgi:hypothetical protein